jgi:hypothetical protein
MHSKVISSPDTARNCHRHLANFFCSVQDGPARWVTIVSNGNYLHYCLSKLLGLSYNKMYLLLMLHCGLIKEKKIPKIQDNEHSYEHSSLC